MMKNDISCLYASVDQHAKPLNAIEVLIEQATPFADRFEAKKGKLLEYSHQNKRVCYLVHEGTVTIHRRRDGMVLNTEKSPFILGISNHFVRNDNLYIRIAETAKLSRLTLERFNMLIASFNLWEQLCRTLTYNISRIYEHCTIASQMSTQDIIHFQLGELMQESEQIRNNITAANYILARTYLSRSSVMRTLTSLKANGTVSLRRGVLTGYNVAD